MGEEIEFNYRHGTFLQNNQVEEKVEFNHFHGMFLKKDQKILSENMENKSIEDEDDREFMVMFPMLFSKKEEVLDAYNKSLFHVCENYISLSNSKMDIFPNNTFEFVLDILDGIEYNPYRYSFLMSLQFIYQDYLGCLEVGGPSLRSSEKKSQDSYMEITFNKQYQITDFECVNMSLLEQTKTMTEFVMMQNNQQIGPLQKVKYHYRKDI